MKKKSVFINLPVIGILFFACISSAADKGPGEIILRSSVNQAEKTKLAFFPHAVHQGNFDCATCHHEKGEDGR